MAWPATVNPGDTATAAQYNALVAALKTWGGNVDGGNYALSNVASISAGSGGISTSGNLSIGGLAGNYRGYGTDGGQLANTDYHVALTPGLHTVTLPIPVSGQILLLENATGADVTVNAQSGGNMVLWNGSGMAAMSSVIIRNGCCLQLQWTAAGYWREASLAIAQPGLSGYCGPLQPASASVLGGVKAGAATNIAADGTLTVPIVSRQTQRGILQPPGTYNMDGTLGLIQVSLGDGTTITINLPASPILGDTYQIAILITAATTTATVATRSGAIYWGNANVSSIKIYAGQVATFYCYDGSGWIGYCTPSDWLTLTPSNFRINGGTGTVALASTQSAVYQVDKNIVRVRFYLTLTITGSPGGIIFDTNLPVPATGGFGPGTAMGRFMQCSCPAASPAAMYLTPDAQVGAFAAGSTPVNVGSFFYPI